MTNQPIPFRQQKNSGKGFLESLKKQPAIQENFPEKPEKSAYLRRVFNERIHQQNEKEVYNGRKHQLNQETQLLLGEIKRELEELKKTKVVFAKNIEKTISRPPRQTSPHYISFLQHIKQVIVNLRKTVENSSDWLLAWNKRQQKKGSFWNRFLNRKQGGTQFLLSSEHYMTRSAG